MTEQSIVYIDQGVTGWSIVYRPGSDRAEAMEKQKSSQGGHGSSSSPRCRSQGGKIVRWLEIQEDAGRPCCIALIGKLSAQELNDRGPSPR